MRLSHFWVQKGPFASNKHFLGKTNIIFIYVLTHFIVQKFKKFLQCIQNYEDRPFMHPKLARFPNENFFRKPDNKLSSYHSCLSTFQKSKSHINILMKYWRLRNIEISLAERHFWPSLETQIFPRHAVFTEW